VVSVADHIAESTLKKGETDMFRQLMGDLLYYLSSKRQESFKEGLDYVVDEYILSRPSVWRSQDDSLKVVGMAQVMDDLLSKAAPGTAIPSVKVPGELITFKKDKMTEKALDKIGGKRNYIMFFAEGCSVCAAEKQAMRAMMSDKAASKGVNVFLVNVDEILASRPELASDLFDLFDLTSLPFLIETDSKGNVVRRYISF
jgi:thiol-disulfide isomerase/thioredoxin